MSFTVEMRLALLPSSVAACTHVYGADSVFDVERVAFFRDPMKPDLGVTTPQPCPPGVWMRAIDVQPGSLRIELANEDPDLGVFVLMYVTGTYRPLTTNGRR